MSKWQEKRLGEVVNYITRGITPKYTANGIKVINQKCIRDYKINLDFCKETLDTTNIGKKYVQYGDILINSTGAGTLGRVACSKIQNMPITFDSHVTLCRVGKEYNNFFIGYYLHSIEKELENFGRGSTNQTELNINDIKKIKINIPDLVTQEKMADILSTYDDLIENNNRRIDILEQMAQEIYKEWFVRFRFPGHEKVKFVNGIPEGWEVKKIGDIASIKSGYAFKSSWWQEEGIPVIKIKDIQNNGIDTNNFAYVSEIHMEKAKQFIAEPGDIVIALTGATIGKIGLIPFYHKPLLINQRVGKFFCGEKPILNNGYLYILLQQNWIKDLIFMISSSSAAQPNISPNDIEEIKIFYNKNVIEQFNQKISDYILQILKLKNINQNLIKQRDLLLPRLMSGKLEV